MMTLLAFLALTASAQTASNHKPAQPKVIYGADDRLDLHQVSDPRLRALADSTVALFYASSLKTENGSTKLPVESYAASYGLCKEEPFHEQVVGAFCSGSLVAPDVIMTAGHCVTSVDACRGTSFVFGYAYKTAAHDPSTVPAADVYGCAALLGREQAGADWALIKLDRPVTGHVPLTLSPSPVAKGDPLFVIGHPAGLPTKIAGGANVRETQPKLRDDEGNETPVEGFFVANLDTYGGNSGSAVFDARTGQVAGILVRGEQDYEFKQDASGELCRVSKVCASDACRGEDVTKLSALKWPAPARVLSVGARLPALLEQAGSFGGR